MTAPRIVLIEDHVTRTYLCPDSPQLHPRPTVQSYKTKYLKYDSRLLPVSDIIPAYAVT